MGANYVNFQSAADSKTIFQDFPLCDKIADDAFELRVQDARCYHFVHILNAPQTIYKGFCMLGQYSFQMGQLQLTLDDIFYSIAIKISPLPAPFIPNPKANVSASVGK